PTYLGVERTKFVARYLAPLLYYWTKLMSPVIRIADWTAKAILGVFGVTIERSWSEAEVEEEPTAPPADRGSLRRQMGEVLSRGSVSPERREEVLNAFEIGETPARDVMIPLAETVGVYTESPPEENLATVERHPEFTRYPLFDGEPPAGHEPGEPHGESSLPAERVVGVVYTSGVLPHVDDLRAGAEEFRDIAAPPLTVPAETTVADVIDQFQAENAEFAAVVEDRSVIGVVTATDAFEAIAGEIEDPMDAVAVEPESGG
ncbi:MAG: CBS domain-containing protein, partial [Halobaculum sp.]